MAEKIAKLSRFRATLVGAVVGDCIGAHFEDQMLPFVSWHSIQKVVNTLESLSAGDDPFRYTDDTAMTFSVASSLVHHDAFDAEDMAQRFTSEFFREPHRGYGGGVVTVFHKLKQSNFMDVFRPASQQFDGSGSYGNGGSMRISPVALFAQKFDSFNILKDICESTTRLTHTNKNGVMGALLQASAVDLALKHKGSSAGDLNTEQFLDSLVERIQPLENAADKANNEGSPPAKRPALEKEEIETKNLHQPYTDKLIKMKDYLKSGKEDSKMIAEVFGNNISALGSVPTAIYSFLRAKDSIQDLPVDNPFQRSVLYAISMGGDTDTIGSMTGAISGAFYGLDAIPLKWQQFCEGVPDAIKHADDLYKLYETAKSKTQTDQ